MPDPDLRLLLLSCGGTISSVPAGGEGLDAGRAVVPSLTGTELLAQIPGFATGGAHIEARTFSTIPSPDMTFDEIVRLRGEIDAWVGAQPGADALGVVVTHGTDTLEETAFALDVLGAGDVPVVVTGAMRNPSLPSADGAANMLAALATASSPAARGLGVLVAFDEQVHLASLVHKSHTASTGAFVSTPFGPVGYLAEGVTRLVLAPRVRHSLPAPEVAPSEVPVALIASGLSDDGRLLDAVAHAGFRGVVLAGLGRGHLPEAVATSPALARLVEQMPVVVASRVGAGELLHRTYGFVGSELDLAERGLLSAGRLDAVKARVLLTFALAAGLDRGQTAAAFAHFGGYADV